MSKYGCVLDIEFRKKLKKMENEKKDTFVKRLYYPFFKRCADIFCSIVALVIFMLLFPFVAIAIRLDSPGPVIFSQIRVGQRGHLFKIYKLRTMEKDAEAHVDKTVFQNKDNPFLQQKNDPRVTRVGAFLRKYSIDELPQLIRLMVKPGLTGLAQISGRGNLPLKARMANDLEYIDKMSAWLDIKILWKTIFKITQHEGAQ